jgi:tetratricopeptide (TPR) repeat protein
MGNLNEAEKNINNALALGSKDPLLYYHAGIIYRNTGHFDKSKEYMDAALKINPYYKDLYSE